MKCKVCGCELDPNKRYCEKCGNFVNATKSANDSEFSWNTIDFPKPRKMQDIQMHWPDMNAKPEPTYMTPDASEGFVHHVVKEKEAPKETPSVKQETPEAPKAEPQQTAQAQVQSPYVAPSPQIAWTMPSNAWAMPPQSQVVVPQPYNVVAPTISTVAPAVSPMPQMPQGYVAPPMYVTQPLQVVPQTVVAPVQTMPGVAVQAAPVQTMPGVTVPTATMPGVMPAQVQTVQNVQTPVAPAPIMPNLAPANTASPVVDLPKQTYPSVNLDQWLDKELQSQDSKVRKEEFATFAKKNEDFQKLLDEEYARYKAKYNTNATSLNREVAEALMKKPEHVDLKAAVTEDKTSVFPRTEESRSQFRQRSYKSSDTLFNKEIASDFDQMLMSGTKDAEELGDSTLAISNEQLKKEIDEVAQKVEAAYKPYGYEKEKSQQELEKMAAAREAFFKPATAEDLDRTSAVEIKSIFDEWDKERKNADEKKRSKKKKKGGIGKYIIVLLIVLAVFTGADIATVTYAPESKASDFFDSINDKLSEAFDSVFGGFIGSQKDNEPDPELTAQERAAQEANTNIEKITCDAESTKFNEQGTYGYSNLGSTTIVDDEQLILDVTTLIVKYNCAWIDYVNSGNDIKCFDYLKADGDAFRSASSFDGVGSVTETFKKLNIGEIRKDANSIYVFSDELISVKKGNEITEVPSKLIYKVELVGETYRIVEYKAYN